MTPEKMMAAFKNIDGKLWRYVDFLRGNKEERPWPPYVFYPSQWWRIAIEEALGLPKGACSSTDNDSVFAVASTIILGTWRTTKDIVRFDDSLYSSLLDTPLEGSIPCDILRRLPAWGVYIETPGITYDGVVLNGFWACLDHYVSTKEDVLQFAFSGVREENKDDTFFLLPLVLKDNFSVAESWEYSLRNAVRGGDGELDFTTHGPISALLSKAINLVLYICAYGFPGSGGNGTEVPIQRPQPKKTKKGWRLFAADKVTIRHIGKEVGESIRRAKEAEDTTTVKRASMRPHVRRGHWHGYWHGPKKDKDGAPLQQKYKLNWLPPMAVALRDDEEVETAETA